MVDTQEIYWDGFLCDDAHSTISFMEADTAISVILIFLRSLKWYNFAFTDRRDSRSVPFRHVQVTWYTYTRFKKIDSVIQNLLGDNTYTGIQTDTDRYRQHCNFISTFQSLNQWMYWMYKFSNEGTSNRGSIAFVTEHETWTYENARHLDYLWMKLHAPSRFNDSFVMWHSLVDHVNAYCQECDTEKEVSQITFDVSSVQNLGSVSIELVHELTK
jgi:hypothetical protein